ncbi:MAG: DUF1611 domain-containing protein [Chloroflexaceae bacterium]
MHPIQPDQWKRAFATHIVPDSAIAGYAAPVAPPRIGDLLAVEVISPGKHTMIETTQGITLNIFPGDRMIGTFGYRYATDQYEGVVPATWQETCDLLSVGGVCGEVRSAHSSMGAPTRLRILGAVCDDEGQPINLRSFARPTPKIPMTGEVILVVGATMNAGKTTTVGTLVRALSRAGFRVAAAKVTGTAAGKDGRFFVSCGASPVLDFTHCGVPSTAMLERYELLTIYHTLLNRLAAANPDYCIIEIADGIFQRETRMLLESMTVRATVDHVFFAANDSLGAECGTRRLWNAGWPLRAVTGTVTASPLAIREVEQEVDLPCLSIENILNGRLFEVLHTKALALGAADRAGYAA